MDDRQRERWNHYQKMYLRRKRGNIGPRSTWYTDEELMLISTWTDMQVPDDEQGRRLGRTRRAIQQARVRHSIGKGTE